jgi:hypothetical protein
MAPIALEAQPLAVAVAAKTHRSQYRRLAQLLNCVVALTVMARDGRIRLGVGARLNCLKAIEALRKFESHSSPRLVLPTLIKIGLSHFSHDFLKASFGAEA